MVIYRVINKVNEKCYIGKTTQNFEKYKKIHIRLALQGKGKNRPFYSAIRKYGPENFEWSILYECKTKEELNEREKQYIKEYESYGNGYNATSGGDGGEGKYERTDEIKHKISLSLLGHKRSKESKEKQSISIRGKNHPLYRIGHKKESIEKMKKSKRGINNPRAKRYKFISPEGIEFIVEGTFNNFCLEHHLWHNAMTLVHRGIKDNHKGWKCEEIN